MYAQIRRELGNGQLPLLDEHQLRFLDETREAIDRNIAQLRPLHRQNEVPANTDIMQVITASEENLLTIVQRLKNARTSGARFKTAYPQWKRKRDECTAILPDIADSINADRYNCNVSKLVGQYTSLFGGILTATSAVFVPITMGATTPLTLWGAGLVAAGCSTTFGTSLTETALLKSKVDQAQQLIDEDQRLFANLGEWLQHAGDLQEALEAVLRISVVREAGESIRRLVDGSIDIQNNQERRRNIDRYVNFILTNLFAQYIGMEVPIVAIGSFLTVLVAIFLLLKNTENRFAFDFASLTIRSILGIASLVDDTMDVFRLTTLMPGSAAVAKNLAKSVTKGAVAVVGLVLDVMGIIMVSKDMEAGSLSPEAKKIKEAAEKMKEEADILARIYNQLPSLYMLNIDGMHATLQSTLQLKQVHKQ